MRVRFSHTYSMTEVRALCERGEYPRQHLWGADALERAGHEVAYGPFGGSARLARATRLTRGKLGYLDQEAAMLRSADLLYSGDQNLTRGLAYLRRARLMRARLATVFHSIGPPGPAGAWVRGADTALCLSRRTRDVLVEGYGRGAANTTAVAWGPDLAFAGYRNEGFEYVVSAGKTGRDVTTLREALQRTQLPSKVYAPAAADAPRDLNEVLVDIARASVVAIPLADTDKLLGLSEFNDAIACGKPVVMTRSRHFDFDIEGEGFGRWVDPGDAGGLANALEEVAAAAGPMGERARAFAERSWNYEIFCDQAVEALSRC